MKKRLIAIVMTLALSIGFLIPVASPSFAATTLTWDKPAYYAVNDYCYIRWKVKAPSTVTWKGAQGNIYDENGNRITLCHENFTIKSGYLIIEYNVKKDMRDPKTGKVVTLKPGKYYYFMFQAKTGGKWYNSPKYKFLVRTVEDRAINKFSKDSRWKDNIVWKGGQTPKYNTSYSSKGCCAYAADFLKYMYGKTNIQSGTKYTNVSKIKAGDIIHLKGGYGHWFVVLKRNSNGKLVTAEGAAYNAKSKLSNRVYVATGKYYIKNGKLYGCGKQISDKYGTKTLSWDYGYRYY